MIRSRSDARALPRQCFSVTGEVEVVGSDLDDLELLKNLREVTTLRISENPRLRTTAGLERVKVSGLLEVKHNPMLANLVGLERTSSPAGVLIADNPLLVSVDGLKNVRTIAAGGLELRANGLATLAEIGGLTTVEGELRIEGHGALQTLSDLNRLGSVGRLLIQRNNGLRSLELDLERVLGDVIVSDNPALTRFGGLSNLQVVEGNFTVSDNASLTVIDGFSAKFQTIGQTLSIVANPALNDIFELKNVYSVGGSLIITYNTSLSDCRTDDLERYLGVIGADTDIGDNSGAWEPCYE